MAKIHGLIYVLIGLFIVLASWKINYNDLILFFYLGWVFVLVGIVKMLFSFGKNKGVKNLQHKSLAQPQHSMQHQQKHHYKRCHRCGNVMRLHDIFCNKCGLRV